MRKLWIAVKDWWSDWRLRRDIERWSSGKALSGGRVEPTEAVKAFEALTPEREITPELLDTLEATLFELLEKGTPGIFEIEVPVTHTFTPRTYVREGVMPKGAVIIGNYHRDPHHCVVLSGRMSLLNADRSITEITGPASFMAGEGRKVGYMHTDVVMQNIHPTEGWDLELLKDVDKMEEYLYRRTEAWKRHQQFKTLHAQPERKSIA